jgi:hypothetical protein
VAISLTPHLLVVAAAPVLGREHRRFRYYGGDARR